MTATRLEVRGQWPDIVRIQALEGDADGHDAQIDKLSDGIESVKRILVGVLISVTTGTILLALNLLAVK